MSTVINFHQAKTHLSRILDEVAAGAEVVIAKAGKPVARLVPLESGVRPNKLGGLKGRIKAALGKTNDAALASYGDIVTAV